MSLFYKSIIRGFVLALVGKSIIHEYWIWLVDSTWSVRQPVTQSKKNVKDT